MKSEPRTVDPPESSVQQADLRSGPVAEYLTDYLSPAFRFDRAVPASELSATLDIEDESETADWYYVRLRQSNDEWAWSSPIWLHHGAASPAH